MVYCLFYVWACLKQNPRFWVLERWWNLLVAVECDDVSDNCLTCVRFMATSTIQLTENNNFKTFGKFNFEVLPILSFVNCGVYFYCFKYYIRTWSVACSPWLCYVDLIIIFYTRFVYNCTVWGIWWFNISTCKCKRVKVMPWFQNAVETYADVLNSYVVVA